jgi:signal transduction histidine kinase
LLDAVSPGTGLRAAWGAVAFLLAASGTIAALLAWQAGEIQREWLVGAAVGTLLLAVAGVFDAILLARSRKPLDVAHRTLRIAAEDLASSYAALAEAHRALGETAEARDRALASLRAAVREREAFLASISHDLNTPLTVIKGHAQILRGRALRSASLEAEKVVRAVASIDSSAVQMEAMIDELIELARMEMGQEPDLERRPLDLVALTRRLVDARERTTDRHRIRFEPREPSLVGDLDGPRLERVIGNLLENAVKFSPAGGEIVVSVGRGEGGAFAVLTVRDQGLGIPADDLPRVFERFYRASNVDGLIDGSGLGLAGVRYIVEAHGGSIEVESRQGSGSAFTVRLPLALPASRPMDGGSADAATPASPPRSPV